MPRHLALKDTKNIYFAYKIGTALDGTTLYSEIKTTRGQLSQKSGQTSVEEYGKVANYNNSLLLNYTNDVAKIDIYTKIWVNYEPETAFDNADYEIVQLGQNFNGIITLFIASLDVSYTEIWFSIGDKIYSQEVMYNEAEKFIRIPDTKYFPIDLVDNFWLRQPEDIDTTETKMSIDSYEFINDYLKIQLVKVVEEEVE